MNSVLYISPNDISLENNANLLQHAGYRVFRASNFPEAQFCLHKLPSIKAIIVDVASAGDAFLQYIEQLAYQTDFAPLLVLINQANLKQAVSALKLGAHDFLLEPYNHDEILESLQSIIDRDIGSQIKTAKTNNWAREHDLFLFQPRSILRKEFQKLGLISKRSSFLLISGERGVLKHKLAHISHFLSPQRFKPFLRFDCCGKSEEMAEKQLFGWKNFCRELSTVKQNSCALMQVNGGTLYFNELTDLPKSAQYKLIDFFDQVERQSSSIHINPLLNMRIIGVTDLAINSKKFKDKIAAEFLQRIFPCVLQIPKLSERREDIPEMAAELIRIKAMQMRGKEKQLSDDAIELLRDYSWPGNDEELEKVIEYAFAASESEIISMANFKGLLMERKEEMKKFHLDLHSYKIEDVEQQLIHQVLEYSGGNMSKTASFLGISRGTLYNKLKKYGIEE